MISWPGVQKNLNIIKILLQRITFNTKNLKNNATCEDFFTKLGS